MGDVDEVAAILDLITATQIQLHALAMVLEETGVKNVESRLDAIRNRLHREKFQATRAAIKNNFEHASWSITSHRSWIRRRQMARKRTLAWTKKTPTREGWYWYRDDDRSAVLHSRRKEHQKRRKR